MVNISGVDKVPKTTKPSQLSLRTCLTLKPRTTYESAIPLPSRHISVRKEILNQVSPKNGLNQGFRMTGGGFVFILKYSPSCNGEYFFILKII